MIEEVQTKTDKYKPDLVVHPQQVFMRGWQGLCGRSVRLEIKPELEVIGLSLLRLFLLFVQEHGPMMAAFLW